MKPVLKYGIIAIAWILFLLIGYSADRNGNEKPNSESVSPSEVITDTADEKLNDLKIGDSVTIYGVSVTVNSVTNVQTSTGSPAYEVNITYNNHSGGMISASPYDWSTVLHTGSDRAHVGGDSSFSLQNIYDGQEWTGVVTLWAEEKTEKIKFDSSSINLLKDKHKTATWLLDRSVDSSNL